MKNTTLKKNILIITHHFPPEPIGRATRINGLIDFLKNKYSITVIAPPPTFPISSFTKIKYLTHREKFDNFTLQRIWTFQPTKPTQSSFQILANYMIFPFLTSFFLLANLQKFSSVIISTPPEFTLFNFPLIKLFRKKLILDVGDLPINIPENSNSIKSNRIIKKFIQNFQIKCWKNANLIMTNSKIVTKEITKFVKDSQKIKYFPFNVDSDFFKNYNCQRENRIIYTGMISPAQNIESFIESMAIIVKKIPNLKFEMFGWGKSTEKIKQLISDYNLEKNCRINKPVPREQIPELLSKSIAGLIPLNVHSSLRYAMPTKTFEYMSCSLPIFSYGGSEELEEIIKNSESGIFVHSNDPQELAAKLIEFLTDKEILDQYASNGRKFIEKKMSYSDLIDQIT